MSVSVASMGDGKARYYSGLAQEDYYTKGGESPGKWQGRGAEILGLTGIVENEKFHRIFDGFDPDTGKDKLRQNAGAAPRVYHTTDILTGEVREQKRHAVAGFDVTFSAPKSVSTLWGTAEEGERKQIESAHAQAVKAAISYLEDYEAQCRIGEEGQDRAKASLIVAEYRHSTSRALDPQLHSHALVLNIGVMEDGRTATLEGRNIYRAQKTLGAIYHAELAKELESRLEVTTRKTKNAFEIEGVPEDLCDRFSTRRKAIQAWCEERGVGTSEAGETAALATRERKAEIDRQQLFTSWQDTAREMGFSPHMVPRQPSPRDLALATKEAISYADDTLTDQNSTFRSRDSFRRIAESGTAQGLGYAEVKAIADAYLESTRAIPLGTLYHETVYTSPDMLRVEREMIERVEARRHDSSHVLEHTALNAALCGRTPLDEEKQTALKWVTTTPGSVKVISGLAGTGKSTTLAVAREAWESEGYYVSGLALSAVAAKGLEQSSGIKSTTIAKFLLEQGKNPFLSDPSRPSYRQEGDRDRYALNSKTILVVDESGMVGTRQMATLIDLVDRAGSKLVLVGDPKQLQSIEAGGAHKAIAARVGEARLEEIARQRHEWARGAVKAMSDGQAHEVLRAYAQRGLLSVEADRNSAIDSLIERWKENGAIADPKPHLILAARRDEASLINRHAQIERKLAGHLGTKRIDVGDETLYEGDRVLFTKNSRSLGVENGTRATVAAIDRRNNTLTAILDNSETSVTIPLKRYDDIQLGYCVTTHKGQGQTVEHAYVLAGGTMQHREMSYVQISRSREETAIFTDRETAGTDLSDLVRQMEQSRQKELAVDVVSQAPTHQSFSQTQYEHRDLSM